MRCPHSFVLPRVGGRDVFERLEFDGSLKKVTGMTVPCGKCIVCRKHRARQWAARVQHELEFHQYACYITLTYDDDHIPYIEGEYTLWKHDLQLFIKRLRKKIGKATKIKYLACGEYGDRTSRPHYHAIILGWQPEDLSRIGDITTSEILEDVWKQGQVAVGAAAPESIYYVTGYIINKLPSKALRNRTKEFICVSQGMGLRYAMMYSEDVKQGTLRTAGKFAGVPMYYRKKMEVDNLSYFRTKLRMERKLREALQESNSKIDLATLAHRSRTQSENELSAKADIKRRKAKL